MWLWFPILLCCCVGFCALAYYLYSYYRRRLKKTKDTSGFMDEDFQDGPYVDYNEVAPQPMMQDMPMAMEPMPVIDQAPAPMEAVVPPLVPMENNIFGTPNLLSQPAVGPQTIAMPMGTNLGGFPTVPSGRVGSFQPYGGSMASQMPAYGAYGAYGGTQMGGFPTNSMRIG
jgi:hypothetical protein